MVTFTFPNLEIGTFEKI